MKIRSYKGHSLEKIYEAIQKELGSEAVVVSTRRPEGVRSLLPSFLGGQGYELIAVVDDASCERHSVAQVLDSESLQKLARQQTETQRRLDRFAEDLHTDLRNLARAVPAGGRERDSGSTDGVGAWDERFLKAVRALCPSFSTTASRAQRREAVCGALPVEEQFPVQKPRKPHVIVLVGPTGSGKTTTLAKLAARWTLESKLKVGLISTDTFRVAAVDQLKEYATLLGLELKVAFSAAEAAKAVKAFADRDVILVDTAGRSQYDHAGLTGLRGLLQGIGTVTVLLMAPANMDRGCMVEMARNFRILGPSYLVVTKTDEAREFGQLTYAVSETGCPIAFLTNGQRVPQDLQGARAGAVADLLVPEEETAA